MAETPHRLIRKPPGLDSSLARKFGESLAQAVRRQQRLARHSPHVLVLAALPRETDDGFVIDHEPAAPLFPEPGLLFDPRVATTPPPEILDTTVALFDALRAAHADDESEYRSHGGICPGALVRAANGIIKVTDFGIAPSVCSVLGPEAYAQLAVSTLGFTKEGAGPTAVWEILTADEFERDDRICAFIDPEKYRSQIMTGFEPGSDVIAAGFLLHLMAEHTHPFLPDPDAHRMVEMSEFMAMSRYSGARRKDLRDSTDPAIQRWCELVGRTLSLLPQDRPAAVAVCEGLAPFIRPVDAADLLRRELASLGEQLHSVPLDQAVDGELAAAIEAASAQTNEGSELAALARSMHQTVQARNRLLEGAAALEAEEVGTAERCLDDVLRNREAPAPVLQKARDLRQKVRDLVAVSTTLEQVASEFDRASVAAPQDRLKSLNGLDERLTALSAGGASRPRLTAVRDELKARVLEAIAKATAECAEIERRAEAEREREAQRRRLDAEQANQWVQEVERLLVDEDWDTLDRVLNDRPTLEYWPEDAIQSERRVREGLEEHLRLQQVRAEMAADQAAAERWIEPIVRALDQDQWDEVEKRLAAKPSLRHWPDTVSEQVRVAADRLSTHRRRESQLRSLEEWIQDVEQLITGERWALAADRLSQRPEVDEVPPEVAERARNASMAVQDHLEALERQRKQMAADQDAAEEWIETIRARVSERDWTAALSLIDAPPRLEFFPPTASRDAEQLRSQVLEGKRKETQERQAAQELAVLQSFRNLVTARVRKEFARLLEETQIKTSVRKVVFADPDDPTLGEAEAVLGLSPAITSTTWVRSIEFDTGANGVFLVDDQGALEEALDGFLVTELLGVQRRAFDALVSPIRTGLFPWMKATAELAAPTPRLVVEIDLAGTLESAGAEPSGLPTFELAWDASVAEWRFDQSALLLRHAALLLADRASPLVREKTASASALCRTYADRISWTIEPPRLTDLRELASPVRLNVQVSWRIDDSPNRTIASFTVSSPRLGELGIETDLEPLVRGVAEVIVQTQRSDAARLMGKIKDRLIGPASRARVVVTPAEITQPVEHVGLELSVRRRPSLRLVAPWNERDLVFTWDDGRESELTAWSEAVNTAPRRPHAMVPVVLTIVVILGAAGGGFWAFRSAPQPVDKQTDGLVTAEESAPLEAATTPPDPSSGFTVGGDRPPGQPDPDRNSGPVDVSTSEVPWNDDDVTAAVGQVAAVLRSSPHLGDQNSDELVIVERPKSNSEPLSMSVRGLGSAGRDLVVGATRDERSGEVTLPPDDVERLSRRIAEMDRRLSLGEDQGLAGWLAARLMDSEVGRWWTMTADQVTCRPKGRWTWEAEHWVNPEILCTLRRASSPAPGDTPQESQWETLTELVINAVLDDDQLSSPISNEAFRERLVPLVLTALTRHQRESLGPLDSNAAALVGPERGTVAGLVVTLDPGSAADELRSTVAATIQAPGLQPRSITLVWNPTDLAFILDSASTTRWGEVTRLHAVLSELNRTLPEDHWIRRISLQPLFELRTVEFDHWMLAVPAPWAVVDDPKQLGAENRLPLPVDARLLDRPGDPAATASLIVSSGMPKPDYWVLVDEYLAMSELSDRSVLPRINDDELRDITRSPSLDDATRGSFLTRVVPFARSRGPVRLQLTSRTGESRIETALDLPSRILVPVDGGWTLETESDTDLTPLGIGTLTAVDRQLRTLLPAPRPAQLLISYSSDGVIQRSWSQADELVRGLVLTVDRVQALHDQLRQQPRRWELENRLNDLLGGPRGKASVSLDAPVAEALIRDIGRIKGIEGTETADLRSITADLRTRLRATKNNPDLVPTLFVEYFCGAGHCFGLVWAASHPSVVGEGPVEIEGPELLRLSAVDRVADGARGVAGSLGAELIRRVLEAVPNAAGGDRTRYQYKLGLVLGIEERMAQIDGGIESLGFLPYRTSLDPTNLDVEMGMKSLAWNSLSVLRSPGFQTRMGDYWILSTLSGGRPIPRREDPALRWAFGVLDAAASR